MAERGRIPYINRWQLIGSPQPFLVYGSYMWGFVFRADMSCLERLVDDQLNHDPSGRVSYTPLAPFVMLGYSALDYIQPKFPPWLEVGGSFEYELAVWVPIRRRGELRPMLFAPYIFVNNPLAVVQGREIYGFAKEMARIPKNGHWPNDFPVCAFVLDEHSEPADRSWRRVVSVERHRSHHPEPRVRKDWKSMRAAATELRNEFLERTNLPALAYLPPLLGSFWPPNARCAFRKQFPDCHDPRKAAYRGVVETNLRVSSVDYGYLLNDHYQLILPNDSCHPMARDLGLHDGDPSLLSYEMKFGFELEAGQEMWRAPEPDGQVPWWLQLYDASTYVPRTIVDLGIGAAQTLASCFAPERKFEANPMPPPTGKKEKVVILGGGVGAIAAAFELTSLPDWKDRFNEITVYQLGWRLGGKGASGRNQDHESRIEEHGIHIWFGYYENAFRMMRECYRECPGLTLPPGEDPILCGFEPYNLCALERKLQDGSWVPMPIEAPDRNNGWPGDDPNRVVPSTPQAFAVEILRFIVEYFVDPQLDSFVAESGGDGSFIEPEVERLTESVRSVLGEAHDGGALWRRLRALLEGSEDWLRGSSPFYSAVSMGLEVGRAWIRRILGDAAPDSPKERVLIVLELAMAALIGIFENRVPIRGFTAIDDRDFVKWLVEEHGADKRVATSEWVRAFYSQAFAFEGGNVKAPKAAAGTMLRDVGRMLFTYRHAFLFKMRSAMGDVVFAPLYRVLKQRGVKFEFFHRVTNLGLSQDGNSIAEIHMKRQATLKDAENYDPLVEVSGYEHRCWPNQPKLSDLVEGRAIQRLIDEKKYVNLESSWSAWRKHEQSGKTLKYGDDFDLVVLGIPVPCLEELCKDLIAERPSWHDMVHKVQSVRTQASQLWLDKGVEELGAAPGLVKKFTGRVPENQGPLLTAFVEPIDTWGDMSQTLKTEGWKTDPPKQVAYFCGPMADSQEPPHEPTQTDPPDQDEAFPSKMNAEVRQEMLKFLTEEVHHLWPQVAPRPDHFDWNVLHSSKSDENRLDDQFFLANIEPTERYVLSLPGTTQHRLRSDRSQFRNLFLAGDWTFNGMNASCVEAAVMSGMRAAHAILGGTPRKILGEDHLDFEYKDDLPMQYDSSVKTVAEKKP